MKTEKAAEANITAALLAGTQNKLLTARSLIDSAIKNKYGAREAELAAKISNLELLSKSPSISLEQKNRADKQLAEQKKKEVENEKIKANAKTASDWLLKAQEGGAPVSVTSEMAKIILSDKPDLAKAFELYAPFAKAEVKGGSDIERFKQFFPNVDITTSAGQQQYLNWKAKEAAAGRELKDIPTTPDKIASRLLSVGLKPNIVTTSGQLTKGVADKVAAQGVPPSVVELINKSILEGATLEEVRQALAQGYGRDVGFGYLDKYMSNAQGEEIENPFK